MTTPRRRAREFALQGLYQWQLNHSSQAVLMETLRELEHFASADDEFLRALLTGVIKEHKGLERELAGAAARRDLHAPIAFSVLAISMATRAASAPFTAARSFAWASSFVVRTALAIGTPVSSCTSRMPRALSLATTSKW